MNHDTSLSTTQTANADSDAISRRAYEIWANEGRPEGCDLRHWLQAERELTQRSPEAYPAAEMPSAAPRPSADSEVTPLQGTRAAAAVAASVGRDAKRSGAASVNPPPEKSGVAARKRSTSTPPL